MRAEITDKDLAPVQVREVHEKLQKWGNPYGDIPSKIPVEKNDVALFVGDHAHYLSPGVIDAVLTLLKAVGVEPALIGIGRNNGYLASSLGYRELAANLMRQTVDELAAVEATSMLVLTPGDLYTFSQLHEERNGLKWPDDVSLQEVVPYLSQYLGAGTIHFNSLNGSIPYAYVDPTHSVRVTGRFDAPRSLLDAVMEAPRVELFWRRERAHPSGDGALQYSQPEIASHLAYSRLGDAVNSGARQIITEDSATLSQLLNHSKRFKIEGKNLYELLAEQLV
jgi:Fe-S oxidoreductase